MVDTVDSKSGIRKGVGVQVPPEAPTSSFYSNIDKSENFEENQTEEYNPLEWAKYMAQAKAILGEATSVAKEYETITKEDGIIN